ncbi:trichothecene C-15 hydroxylase [Microdochium bolleyi]|uniref:Trichothecene C-15 hydroxylase n=1 Tax=Microdochium bolleyi TaxID=196109 RepID=A0A136J197_9PEZI|nr:trichothecene C-15 hydroxylase [Microdochium bolleyi]
MPALDDMVNSVEAYAHHGFVGIALAAFTALIGLSTVYLLLINPLYNIFLHPLRHIPGPKLWAITHIFYSKSVYNGLVHKDLLELHRVYGPVVRVAPNSVNISHPEGQRDLKGHRKGGADENGKDPAVFGLSASNLIGAPREEHTAQRRILSHAFSAQTMVEQQAIIKGYIDKFFEGLRKNSQNGTQLVEMTSWLNWLTFDVIGDLAFGEPFGCLENSEYHVWVNLTLDALKFTRLQAELGRLGRVASMMQNHLIGGLSKQYQDHIGLATLRVRKRLETSTTRPDFIHKMIEGGKQRDHPLSFEKLVSNAELLVVAGSETTATVLSSAVFYLTTNPQALARLSKEIRSAYKDESEVDLLNTQHLAYLNAVVNETLRIQPPVAGSGSRIAAPGGTTVAGHFIPGGTICDTDIWTIHHNPSMFTLADSFVPERFLGDDRFKNDRLDAVEPFSAGPRNCIGRNLAYAEIRMVLARLVLNFDMEINPADKTWNVDQKAFFVWDKPLLRVWLKPRTTSAV